MPDPTESLALRPLASGLLTRILTSDDYDTPDVLDALTVVDQQFTPDQHPQRRWEYALAVMATQYVEANGTIASVLDVGGTGSPLGAMLQNGIRSYDCVDPRGKCRYPVPVEHLLGESSHDVVLAISVAEHVPDLLPFLQACVRHVKPGGLLLLTVDCVVDVRTSAITFPEDSYHFHWMRERIFSISTLNLLAKTLCLTNRLVGGQIRAPYEPLQPLVYDYTFASLCFERPRSDKEG